MSSSTHRPDELGLATDLYQLTMAAAYHANGRHEQASFELFVRKLPPKRSYLIIAGLAQALDYLHYLRFSVDEIDYLRSLPAFAHVDASFFEYLRSFRFTGEVWAMPEGTIAFAEEPLLRVTAPLIEAQMVETYLLATINFQTLIASKAARIAEAAGGHGIVEFGSRRAHTMNAAFYAARAAFIGGCIGTSNLEAGRAFNLPVYGTLAHSFVMSFASERAALEAYFRVFPENTTLLLDTYNTINAAHYATKFGSCLRGVRLDSGDLGALAREVRMILDAAGLTETKIMASGDLNEEKIAQLVKANAPIDLYGVGTELATSYDAPALGGIYKLVELESDGRMEPKMKLSCNKVTHPYRKQIWRRVANDGYFIEDMIAFPDEDFSRNGYESLLVPVMRNGELIAPLPDVHTAQMHAHAHLAALPSIYRQLESDTRFPVRYSPSFERCEQMLRQELE